MHAHQFWWAWLLQFRKYGYLSKTAKFPFPTMDYSPWSSKNLINQNQLKKFVQVGIDVTCMHTSFGGCGFFSFERNRRSVQLYDNNYSIIIIIIIRCQYPDCSGNGHCSSINGLCVCNKVCIIKILSTFPHLSLSLIHTHSLSLPLSQGWTGASCNVSLIESSQVFSSVISSSQIFSNDYYISPLTSSLSGSSSVTTCTSTVPVAALQDNLILNKSINECNNGTINR